MNATSVRSSQGVAQGESNINLSTLRVVTVHKFNRRSLVELHLEIAPRNLVKMGRRESTIKVKMALTRLRTDLEEVDGTELLSLIQAMAIKFKSGRRVNSLCVKADMRVFRRNSFNLSLKHHPRVAN
jgi:hypothetical protein